MPIQINGAKLRQEMNRRGLSQTQLAKAARLDPNTIAAACRGTHPIHLSSYHRIALALQARTPIDVDLVAAEVVA